MGTAKSEPDSFTPRQICDGDQHHEADTDRDAIIGDPREHSSPAAADVIAATPAATETDTVNT